MIGLASIITRFMVAETSFVEHFALYRAFWCVREFRAFVFEEMQPSETFLEGHSTIDRHAHT